MKALLLATLLVTTGCRIVETRSVSSSGTPVLHAAKRARTWDVICGSETLGYVVLFQEHGLARDSVYVVRNPWNQDMGMIDGLGRAYRYLPHEEDPAWVGSGTVAAGAQSILGATSTCELIERLEDGASPVPGTTGDLEPATAENAPSAAEAGPFGSPPAPGGLPQYR